MTAAMPAKPKQVERRITSGNVFGMIIALLSSGGVATYVHFVPSAEAAAVKTSADQAVAKAAVLEATVATHTQELGQIAANVDELRINMAVIKSQSDAAKLAADKQSDKLDRILDRVSRLQGASGQPAVPGR